MGICNEKNNRWDKKNDNSPLFVDTQLGSHGPAVGSLGEKKGLKGATFRWSGLNKKQLKSPMDSQGGLCVFVCQVLGTILLQMGTAGRWAIKKHTLS